MEFTSERARQEYWKKKKLEELRIEDENSTKLSKAYQNVVFGEVLPIKDNRSVKEIEDDTIGQARLAKKNAMILMNDDGYEADRLLKMITRGNFITFNRYALEIIDKLRLRIGKVTAIDIIQEIFTLMAMGEDVKSRIPPTSAQIKALIDLVTQKFDMTNSAVEDIIERLDAYKTIVNLGSTSRGFFPIDGDELDEIASIVEEGDIQSVLSKVESITQESLSNLKDDIDDDAKTVMTTESTQEQYGNYANKTESRKRNEYADRYWALASFLNSNDINEIKDATKQKELAIEMKYLLTQVGVGFEAATGVVKMKLLFDKHEDSIRKMAEKINREGDKGFSMSANDEIILSNIDIRLSEVSGSEIENAKMFIDEVERFRKFITYTKTTKLDKENLAIYNIIRYIGQDKKRATNISVTTVKSEINRTIYDASLAYLRAKYFPNSPDANTGVNPKPPGADINTLPIPNPGDGVGTLAEEETKTGSGFRKSRFGKYQRRF